MATNKQYSAKNITILEGLEAVRKRPAMYIGDSSTSGLHHMVYEIVDNSIDEALAGFANKLTVVLEEDGFVSVEDNGRGIPTDIHPKTGTIIRFKPDKEIFDDLQFNLKTLQTRFRRQAYLTAGLTIELHDKRKDEDKKDSDLKLQSIYAFHFENGVRAYIQQINKNHKIINPTIFYVKKEIDGIETEVALQYTDDLQENVMAFANNVHNPEGGTHLAGFRMALTKSLNEYLTKNKSDKEKTTKFTGDDTREGLTAIISVKIGDPQFEGQTKIKLNNPEVTHAVRKVVEEELLNFLAENPKDARSILNRALLSFKARKAAKAAREAVVRKGALEGGTLPGKLSDCSTRMPDKAELYIVEGDSAGGSAKQGRDRETQAILPLSGKPINSEKYRLDRVLGNERLKDIITVMGAGIGESYDESKLRYHKIIIMNDADVC